MGFNGILWVLHLSVNINRITTFRTKREQLWVAFITVNNVYEVFAR
jgi:pyridoxine 5'-phosphate synthase PdxJ